jgi:Flp pilus assembly protein TadG
MKRDASRNPTKIRGAAAVEMTLLAPLLFMLLFGIVEMSLLLYNQAMITNACREGARFGILFRSDPTTGQYSPATVDEIEVVVNNYLANHLIGFPAGEAATTATPEEGLNPGDPRTVRVEYPYNFLVLPGFVNNMMTSLELSAEAVMRME